MKYLAIFAVLGLLVSWKFADSNKTLATRKPLRPGQRVSSFTLQSSRARGTAGAALHRDVASHMPRWVKISPPSVSTNFNSPPSNFGFQALALDPLHPRTLYVGTCYQGLWKSTNSGHTWFKVSTGVNSSKLDGRLWSIAVDRFATRTLYVANGYGGEAGVWKSTDGGVGWEEMLPATSTVGLQTSTDVSTIALDPYRGGHILVAFHGPWSSSTTTVDAGILESVDGGRTWIVHKPRRGWGWGSYISFFGNSSSWLIGTQRDGFWLTRDGGKKWSKVSSVAASDGGGAVYRARNGLWYASAFGTILRSANDGATWQPVGPYGGYYFAITGDGHLLYTQQANVGPVKYLYSLESDGQTWLAYDGQTFTGGSRSMAYDPIDHIVYSSNGNAGVWKLQTSGT
jgi:hypothetical protein